MNSEAVFKAEHTGVRTGQGQMRQQIDAASLSQDLVAKCPVTSQSSIRSLPRNSDLDTVSLSEVLEAPSQVALLPLLPVSLQVTFTLSKLPGNSTVAAKLSAGSLVFNPLLGARI